MTTFTLAGLPTPLEWAVEPAAWALDGGVLSITSGEKTDLFHDPASDARTANAACALFQPDPLFTVSAHVTVGFGSTYDAGALLVWADDDHWGKVCYEYSPQAQPMVVSVVTNGRSDDCNSVVFPRNDIYLRVSRLGRAFAFHYSEDGSYWHMVRHFTLHGANAVFAGLVSQSPTGPGCTAQFADVTYRAERVKEIRSGE
jgi:regulation of enolase protein 1 (concanavalin A-like superfamily)